MKIFSDLTDKEILELSAVQINQFIAIEMARKGLVEPFPVKEPSSIEDEMDVEVFCTNGVYFSTMADALACIALNPVKLNYNYQIGYKFKYVDKEMRKEVETVRAFSKEKYDQISSLIKEHDAQAMEYSEYLEALQKYNKQADEIRAYIMGEIYRVGKVVNLYNQALSVFSANLLLAENSSDIAFSFLKNQFPNLREICKNAEKLEIESELINLASVAFAEVPPVLED